jgi:hypothetical protein
MNANLRLPDDLYEAAQRLVAAEGTPLPELLARLIERRLRRLPRVTGGAPPRQPADPELHEWRQELL